MILPASTPLLAPSVALLSTYPPTACGIGTFTYDLVRGLEAVRGVQPAVLAVRPPFSPAANDPPVVFTLEQQCLADYDALAAFVNREPFALVHVQHEFGIFGGPWGLYLLEFLRRVRKPVVTTLHTVVPKPNRTMRELTRKIYQLSSRVVIMNPSAGNLLRYHYDLKLDDRLRMIHHGAPQFDPGRQPARKATLGLANRTLIATFGLIHPRKGIEYAINGLAAVVNEFPDVCFLILGETHPFVRSHHGEMYRQKLEALIHKRGLENHVILENRFLPKAELIGYLEAADIFVTPYLDPDQYVSGVLCYAVAAGKAIVSTPFLYAREMLADDRGLLVNFRGSRGFTQAFRLLLGDPKYRATLERRTRSFGARLAWRRVAEEHVRLYGEILEQPITLSRAATRPHLVHSD